MMSELDKLRLERTQLRRLFSRSCNEFNKKFEEDKDFKNEEVSAAFMKVTDKAERLFAIDKQVSEIIFSTISDQNILDKETDESEMYRENWLSMIAFKEKLINNSGTRTNINFELDTTNKRNYRLPKLEIKKFDGNIRNWISFWASFKKVHDNDDIEAEDKFQYLFQATLENSSARELVESFPPSAANYSKAVEQLKNRFGREELLIELYVRELLNLVLTQASNKEKLSLSSLYDKLETQLRSLETLGVTSNKYASMLAPLVESALPENILREWERHRSSKSINSKNRLEELLTFLRNEVEGEERILLAKTVLHGNNTEKKSSKEAKSNKMVQRIPSVSALTNIKLTVDNSCIFCEKQHSSESCFKAQDLNLEEVQKIIKDKGRCLICLKGGHLKRQCKTSLKCIICTGRHVPLVCTERKRKPQVPKSLNPPPKVEQNLLAAQSNQVYLKTIKIVLRNGDKEFTGRLFFDDGSQRSYITKKMVSLLGYEPLGTERLVHGLFGGKRSEPEDHIVYRVRIASTVNDYACNFQVLDKDMICESLPVVAKRGPWIDEFEELNIFLSDKELGDIDILVGADIAGKLLTGKRKILKCGLVAIETYLGWTIMGKVSEEASTRMNNVTYAHLDISASDLWRLDLIGIEDSIQVKSRKEQALVAKTHFEKTVRIREDGRYEVSLPWLENHPPLPHNYDIARKRLDSTRNKLLSSDLFLKYDQIFTEWLSSGIIEAVTDSEDKGGQYLPHRPVVKEHSTTKIRPVFDASACHKGKVSLNQCLEKGPNLIEVIPNILLRFRMERLGVISDIEKAFLQIYLNPDDRNFLKFLWFDACGNIKIFRHVRVVFGVNCSPFLLGAVIEHLLERTRQGCCQSLLPYSEKTIVQLKGCFYVDNCVTSLANEDDLRQFVEESSKIFEGAGFKLRGWEYTQPGLLETVNTPVLGLIWDRKNDTLKIKIPDLHFDNDEILTRRMILSATQRIFDPLGITAPTTLIPKLLIQETWISGSGWDDSIDKRIQRRFIKWMKEIPFLKDLEIPRWMFGVSHNETRTSLHTFCDASQSAYAAVCFLRWEKEDSVGISLIEARARVAPVKKCTIPRLELLAALIGARLAHSIQQEIGSIQCYFWSDSTTVLAWIRRDEPWGVFVWNRVREIRELTDKDDWYHVPGLVNPADLLSRGCNARELIISRWWEGPNWLRFCNNKWPVSDEAVNEEEVVNEKKKTISCTDNCKPEFDSSILVGSFSYYSSIVRLIGWILRFINNLRQKIGITNKLFVNSKLSLSEIDAAEKVLIRLVQNETFASIEDKRIKKLKPIIDQDGLLRVRTKIWARKDSLDFRAPLILPTDNLVVERLVLEVHLKNMHIMGQGLLNLLREKYWIIRGRQAIRKILKGCVICRRFAAKNLQAEPPPLPEDRVRDARVFEVIGIDLAGPLFLRDGSKVWITLFTCAIYRAVHLDIVSSLSTESFMLALRRFIARRGRPSIIYTDNGTNFKGTSNALKHVKWRNVKKENNSIGLIEWRFNPPSAPWWGGFFERLIGIVKMLLKKILGKACLNHDELYTIICECESTVNSRPITYISEDSSDLVAITPQMFLRELIEGGVPDFEQLDTAALNRRLRYRARLKEELRKRFRTEYLGTLNFLFKEGKGTREPVVGEIVLVGSDNKKRLDWPLAIIEGITRGKDDKCRLVQLRTAEGRIFRPIQRIYPLEVFHNAESAKDDSLSLKQDQRVNNDGTVRHNNTTAPQDSEDGYCEAKTTCGRRVRLPARYRV